MGKIVVSSLVSLDGYTEGPGGDVMAMPMDMAFGNQNAERMAAASSLLFGATTFHGMVSYWPHQVNNPDAGEDDRFIARRYADGIPITVVSDSLTPEETEPYREQTTIVPRSGLAQRVAELRQQEGEALVFGSRTLWTELMAQGFVDVLYLMVGPKIVAGDHRILEGVPETDAHLMDARRLPDSEIVLLTYGF
ncbi:MAG: deaminase [Kocuria rhizophila]|uniref:dihydrofolate reductase family protein n=1 Tax=Kocuria carniphila TaxID=262208 RepID=UPI000DB6DF41|nr:dihydrofolate reductase family protein [Kocuria carniphila]MCT1802804.1 dihydrofolate reductase family protein [Kocuria carniphila]PZP31193.1 MAG: deaminase [Kocuria rhizophila]